MTAKIKECTWTIPVLGLQFTDCRPTFVGEWEDIVEGARKVAETVGNTKLVERLSGAQTGLTEPLSASDEILGDGVLFNKEDHTYTKNGLPYLSGSTFAHMFEKEFPKEIVATKLAEKEGREVSEVLEGWDAKGQISLDYGTLIHKCIETYIKHGATPTNQYLADVVDDWIDVFDGEIESSEMFVQDDLHQLCGVVDGFGDGVLYDWKTGDIHQKIQHTLGKDFPNDRLSLYTLQLNFYKYIIEQNGGKVKKMIIGWLNGEHWEKVDVPAIDIKSYLEQVWKPKKLSSN